MDVPATTVNSRTLFNQWTGDHEAVHAAQNEFSRSVHDYHIMPGKYGKRDSVSVGHRGVNHVMPDRKFLQVGHLTRTKEKTQYAQPRLTTPGLGGNVMPLSGVDVNSSVLGFGFGEMTERDPAALSTTEFNRWDFVDKEKLPVMVSTSAMPRGGIDSRV